jgi:hypothetical protein
MKTSTITTTASEVLARDGNRVGYILQNLSDTDVYVDMENDGDTLTADTGVKVAAGGSLIVDSKMFARRGIRAIHAGSGNKIVRAQEVFE